MIFKSSHSLPENPIRKATLTTLFLALLIAGVPHIFSLPIWVTALYTCCILIKYFLVKTDKIAFAPFIPILLAVPVISLVYFQFGTLLGIEASISLLMVMLGLKVLELKDYRDAMLSLFLGFFVVVTVFLFQQQLITLIYLLLCGFLLTLSLIKLNDYTGRQSHRQQVKTTFRLGVGSIPIILILFLIFPRLNSPLWSLPGNNGQSQTGMSESMSPGQFSKLVKSTEPAFRVSFNSGRPEQHQLYWRGPVLESFDGKRWSRSYQSSAKNKEQAPSIQNIDNTFNYQITTEAHNNRWIFPLDLTVSNNSSDVSTNQLGETQTKEVIRKAALFNFSSAINFSMDTNKTRPELQTALDLPARTAPKTRALARELYIKSGGDKAGFVELVMNRFTQQPYSYTLEPKPLSSDYIDSFMTDTMEGFCEHFSSSFVVMMREVGIPARVVTGYQGGEYNENGGYLLIRQSDAHAWTEVWLEGEGWIRKDPTSMVSPERVNQGLESAFSGSDLLPSTIRISFLKKLNMRWDTLNYYWSKWVISYNNTLRTELVNSFKQLMQNIGKQLIISLTALAVLVFIALMIKQILQSIRSKDSAEQQLYMRFLRQSASLFKTEKNQAETELQYAQRLCTTKPTIADDIKQITSSYVSIRYGNQRSPESLQSLKQKIASYCKISSVSLVEE